MEYLNYSRQISAHCKKNEGAFRAFGNSKYADHIEHIGRMHRKSEKFILPKGGLFVSSDETVSGLDNERELHLPFKNICLEYFSDYKLNADDPIDAYRMAQQEAETGINYLDGTVHAPKRAIYVTEEIDPGFIHFAPCFYVEKDKQWIVMPFAWIPRRDFKTSMPTPAGLVTGGYFGLTMEMFPLTDYNDEFTVVMHFLNVLALRNVHVSKPMISRKAADSNKSRNKGVLPYDSYRVLEIEVMPLNATDYDESSGEGGDRFRPREHVRIGHERTYKSGKKIWINGITVNKDIGHKVVKAYAIKGASV